MSDETRGESIVARERERPVTTHNKESCNKRGDISSMWERERGKRWHRCHDIIAPNTNNIDQSVSGY